MVNLQTRKIGKYTVVDITGRMERLKDSLALKSLLNTLSEESQSFLALNLQEINYLDSGGLNVFVWAHNKLTKANGSLCLVSPNAYVLEMINTLGLEQIIPIYSSEAELLTVSR
jgi:anti-anti-sigma factor